jgi:hypothetical protein
MEFFGWPPGVIEELTVEYRAVLLTLISQRRQAEKKSRPGDR